MSALSKWIMAALIAMVVVALLRNAAGATAIIIGGGTELNALASTLSGSSIKAEKGQFSIGSTKVALG